MISISYAGKAKKIVSKEYASPFVAHLTEFSIVKTYKWAKKKKGRFNPFNNQRNRKSRPEEL